MPSTATHISELIFRYLNEALSPQEHQELEQWKQAHPDNGRMFDLFSKEEYLTQGLQRYVNAEKSQQQVYQRIQTTLKAEHGKKTIHLFQKTWLRYAAAIVLAAGVGIYIWQQRQEPLRSTTQSTTSLVQTTPGTDKAILTLADGTKKELSKADNGLLLQQNAVRLTTPRGSQYQVILPDGSKLWLNAASSVNFPATFSSKERKLSVTGEVYIEVAPDKSRPFIVSCRGTQINVLGTSFNINAYDDEEIMRTTLLEGSIKVKTFNREALLKPNEQAQVSTLGHEIKTVTLADATDVVAWKNGRFKFNDADLETVLRQVARWYDVEVVYEGHPNLRFSGQIGRSSSLEQMITILETSGARFKIEEKKLTVLP